MSDTFTLTVAVRLPSREGAQATVDEAILALYDLLKDAETIELLSILPDEKGGNAVKWG